MAVRLTRQAIEVAKEIKDQLIAHYNITQSTLDAWKKAVEILTNGFPVSSMVDVDDLWIDYEVQRDVLHKHIINIMKKWDPRICSPVSACRFGNSPRIYAYDGQHRLIAAILLGYKQVPCAVVDTDDKNFASYAFEMLNDTGVRRLNPGDLHRNALVRYKNGSSDTKNVRARTMQDQFDTNGIDLQDKSARNSAALRGDNDYFFSHFKYAQKGIELDETGKILCQILNAIKTTYPMQEEIDQGVFIGLLELQRLAGTTGNVKLPSDWMTQVLKLVKKSFSSSHLAHNKAKIQREHVAPGAGWNAPLAMSNFLREVYIHNGGKLNLPYHGDGSKIGIESGNIAPGLFPQNRG